MTSWIDTHAHLGDAQFAADREAVLARALSAGVSRIVEIADAPADWDAAIALSRARPSQVRCTLGLHPYYADQFSEELVTKLEKKILLPEVVGVGEIGLDYVKTEIPKEVQRAALTRLLTFCRDAKKPVVVHCRGAYEDLREILAKVFPGKPEGRRFWGVIHCFSGITEDALFCRDLGFALGADGPVTYPKNDPLREALKQAGLQSLVLETDSPYLPPQTLRGKRNEPINIPEIGARLAQVFGVETAELAAATSANARELYGLAS
jgi:TatD DNase family protein